jgi:hypothetical protein
VEVLKTQSSIHPRGEVDRRLAESIPRRSSHALVIAGVRRCGKSVLQAQLARRLKGVISCNLEDTRLFGLGPGDFASLIAAIEDLGPAQGPVFLDEVQEVPEWQRLVRALLDRGHPTCVTGSNASLLGRELGAKLTGRHLSFEALPFDYREFLAATQTRAGSRSLVEYLDHGGFPAYVRDRDPRILQELLRDVVQRDVATRQRLREVRHVMNLALFLLGHTGEPLSLQTLTKSLAIPTVAQTSRYVEALTDAYLLFALPKHSTSFKQRVVAPNKYYAVDNGLRRATSPQFTSDIGRRLENAVYLALRARGGALFYAGQKDLWECDFVTETHAIQVCAALTPDNQAREVRGLVAACALPGRRKPLLLTLDQRDRIAAAGTQIEVQPAWEWLESGGH